MDLTFYAGIFAVALSTYLIRLSGYFFLKNRKLSPRAERVMDAVPGCVLIAMIAPEFVSGNLANSLGLLVTLLMACRFSLLPTVIVGILATGLFRYFL